MNYRNLWYLYEDSHGDGSYMRLTDAERREQVHTWQNDNNSYDWGEVQRHLHKFKTSMEYVEVDFSDAYASCGCCRLLPACIDLWILKLAPRVLNVSGLLAGGEADLQFGSTRNSTRPPYTPDYLKVAYGLHFPQPCETTKWEAYQVDDKDDKDDEDDEDEEDDVDEEDEEDDVDDEE